MEKAYDPKKTEDALYSAWEESGLFNPDNLPERHTEPYSVMMPPPNVTGVLHLGHALENTIMDTKVRYARMQGKKALLLPGTDHAPIATQVKVEGLLRDEGIADPRAELGREKLVERIREFSEDSKATILSQVRKMGTSADWSRLAYTFDDTRSIAVNELFVRMYNDGLVYQGTRLINWSTGAQSVLSDDELVWEDREEPFYYIRVGDFVIGTVRSETKCADSPLVVHPESVYARIRFTDANGKQDELIVIKELLDDDERRTKVFSLVDLSGGYEIVEEKTGTELAGQEFEYDTYAGKRKFVVLADKVIDPGKGAGAMTISSSHSQDDYDLAKRLDLKETFIEKIDMKGNMTEIAGPLVGLPAEEARKKAADLMQEAGLLVGIDEEYTHSVPICYRAKCVVEPQISKQWFVNVTAEVPGRGKTLKELMIEAVRTGHGGDADKKVTVSPKRFEKVYFHWVENLQDWTISRQIWWGHRIPAWYKGGEVKVSVESPGEGWAQDEDTLDTWFSSGTWTFSTLGWPEETEDMKTFHPTNWIQMGHEILFFWMARMILMSTYALDEIPFKDVYIHGMLRDKDGKKFSKSDGNGVDPLDVIKEYGTDALRLSLIKGIAPGNDSRFYDDKLEDARNFVNKLWNVTRFVNMQEEEESAGESIADRWIQSRLNTLVQEVTTHYEKDEFSPIAQKLYDFLWHEYADWYVEISKAEELNCSRRLATLKTFLHLLHPVAPFITETLAHEAGLIEEGEFLMISEWPQADGSKIDTDLEARMGGLFDLVRIIRDAKASAGKQAEVISALPQDNLTDQEKIILEKQAGIVFNEKEWAPENPIKAANGTAWVEIDLGHADPEKLKKEIEQLKNSVASFENKLGNKKYTDNAPVEIVEETKEKLKQQQALLEMKQGELQKIEGGK